MSGPIPLAIWQRRLRETKFDRTYPYSTASKSGNINGTTVKAVLMFLSTWADFDTGKGAYPGVGVLAESCGFGTDQVTRALAASRELGWIERVSVANSKRGLADVYDLTFPTDPPQTSPTKVTDPSQTSPSGSMDASQTATDSSQTATDSSGTGSTIPNHPSTIPAKTSSPAWIKARAGTTRRHKREGGGSTNDSANPVIRDEVMIAPTSHGSPFTSPSVLNDQF